MRPPYNKSRAAIFLDRDGVINENHEDYVLSWEQVRIIPGSLDALVRLAQTTYSIVIVTNQSAIGRGHIKYDAINVINKRLINLIEQNNGRIDSLYLCPHAPDNKCECRKPKPGLLLQAARELNIDLNRSWIVGDSITDIQAGIAAGVRSILVRSGRGASQEPLCASQGLGHIPVLADLELAVDYILAH